MIFHNVVLMATRESEVVHAGLIEHAARSREEPSCLRFDVHPAPTLPNSWILTERWESQAAIAAHRNGESYRMIYRPLRPLLERLPDPTGIAFDFDRTLTEHAQPIARIIAAVHRHAARGEPVWIVTARNPLYDSELVRDYDEPERLLVSEAVREWELPVAGVRFTNNEPKILHLIEIGCHVLVDDCAATRRDAAQHGIAAIEPRLLAPG